MFGFGKKHRHACGIEVKGDQYERFGKSFCSEGLLTRLGRSCPDSRPWHLTATQVAFEISLGITPMDPTDRAGQQLVGVGPRPAEASGVVSSSSRYQVGG